MCLCAQGYAHVWVCFANMFLDHIMNVCQPVYARASVCVCVSVQARVCLFLALTDYLCERRWISEGEVSALMCGCLVMQSWFYLDSWCPV